MARPQSWGKGYAQRARWHQRTSHVVAYARSSGRRRYNAQRHRAMLRRRLILRGLMKKLGPAFFTSGMHGRLAKLLGVSRPTITRDIHALLGRPYQQVSVRVIA